MRQLMEGLDLCDSGTAAAAAVGCLNEPCSLDDEQLTDGLMLCADGSLGAAAAAGAAPDLHERAMQVRQVLVKASLMLCVAGSNRAAAAGAAPESLETSHEGDMMS
jgi:hypothetical protein